MKYNYINILTCSATINLQSTPILTLRSVKVEHCKFNHLSVNAEGPTSRSPTMSEVRNIGIGSV